MSLKGVITLSLIRSCHDSNNIDNIEIINLNNKDISHIDNLEIFYQIKELHLSKNKIKCIENIEFLNKLELLDISCNGIDTDSLLWSLQNKCIPKTLKIINLSDNPCSNDEETLMALQDYAPEINIIIGIEDEYTDVGSNQNESYVEDNSDDIDEEEKKEEEDEEILLKEGEVIDADAVLKSIVERKCLLQNMETFNITKQVETLNEECKRAIESVGSRREAYQFLQKDTGSESIRKRGDDYQSASRQANQMLLDSRNETVANRDFFAKLKESASTAREQVFAELKKK